MATTVTNTTFPVTYKDDFIDSDGYQRILFNSGKALQARELTQLQTLLQEQITRFGSNIFVDGGVVNGSGFTVNRAYEFIKLANNQLPSATGSELIGATFKNSAGIKFKILEVRTIAADGISNDTLYVKYIDSRAGTAGATPVRIGNGDVIEDVANVLDDMNTAASNTTGQGTQVSVGAGSFFVQGHFVFAKAQTIIASHYTHDPDVTIGFRVEEEVVTSADDDALFDNQGAVPNTAAPGADRYRIRLTLVKKDDITTGQNFVYLFRLTSGNITDEARIDNSYNQIENTLAIRTKEESGNYIVQDFTAEFETDSSNTGPNLLLKVSDGIAYVDGHRVAALSSDIKVPKSTTDVAVSNETIRASYGNFIDLRGGDSNYGIPNINNFQRLNLSSDSAANTSEVIGTARVRALYEQGTDTYRAYLFDIQMQAGRNFENAKSIGIDSSDFMNIVLEGGRAVLKNTSENNLLFPLPRTRPKTITHGALTVQRRVTFTTGVGITSVTGQTGTIPGPGGGIGPGTGYTYVNPSQWILSAEDGNIVNVTPSISGGGSTFDYTGLTQNTNYEVLAMVQKASPTARSKVLTTSTKTLTWPTDADSDGTGKLFFNLDVADIYDIKRLTQTDSDGADLSDNFILDNGQRDNFYDIGRLSLRGDASIKSTINIFCRYRHFTHQDGDFFDVSSYPAAITYEKIPSHKKADGTTVSLRDVVDFRPVATKGNGSSGLIQKNAAFDSDGAGGQPIVNFLPENGGTTVATSINYYQPRIDRLVAATRTIGGSRIPTGTVKVVRGTPNLDPQIPAIPEGSMALYNLTLNANTLNESDTSTTLIKAKGYTMADIGILEDRIDTLTELTTLSLLELDTTSLTVLDSAGLPRTKAGFLVDNFRNFDFSDIDKDDYRAVVDDVEGVLTPITLGKNTRLYADSASSTRIAFKGDTAMLQIDSDAIVIDQNLATEALNVNPFAVIVSKGHTELSPETDEWVETKYLPNLTQNQGSLGTISRARARNLARRNFSAAGFRNTWFGRSSGIGTASVRISGLSGRITRVIADRVVDISVIPWMRSRIVHFRSQGLRPNAQHFLTMDGRSLAAYAREETTFKRVANRNDNARTYTNATGHPSGATDLISDSAGKIIGSFLIPSTSTLRFRTGTQLVQLMDVTGANLPGSTSHSAAYFASAGELRTRERTVGVTTFRIEPPPPPPPPQDDGDDNGPGAGTAGDPLAQSFFVDAVDNPNGFFITKVDCFFRTKDEEGVPVQCQIRRLENGTPVDRPLAGASKFLEPHQVNIPSDLNDLEIVRATPTTFEFDEPVYVRPAQNYAVVLLAETTAYTAYVSKTYDFVLGSTEARVSKQPTLGTLFLSQSGITWTPDQTRDLMFRLKRAHFTNLGGTLKLLNRNPGNMVLDQNPILTDSGETQIKVLTENHGFVNGDKVTIAGLDSATTYAGISGASINGTQTILRVDHTGFIVDVADSAVGSLQVGGSGVTIDGQAMYDQFLPSIQTLLPENTGLSSTIITATGASYGDKRNTTGPTNGSKVLNASQPITLNEFNFLETPSCIFNGTNEASTDNDFPDNSVKLDITFSTNDQKVSPLVDLQRNSLTTFETVIDTQDSSDFSTVNVPLNRIRETNATSGSSAAKHITSPVILEEPAVGLKILFGANRPSASKFRVFFRTATSDEILDEVAYTEVLEDTDNPSDEDKTVFRQYEYLPGNVAGTLNSFTKFQVKIVMIGTNSAKAPTIKDLRIIALVT